MSGVFGQLRALEGPFRRLREPGGWLIGAFVIGAIPRVFLTLMTEGTSDAVVWASLVDEVRERGIMATYRGGAFILNHPPFAVLIATGLRELGLETGIAFPVVFRAPFALLDVATFFGVIKLFAASSNPRWRNARYVLAGVFWLSPVAIIFSSHHGNTDAAVAFCLVAAAAFVAHGRPTLAGLMVGIGVWIKIPGVLAAPLLLLAVPNRGDRMRFIAAAAAMGLAGYLPWLVQDPMAVIRSVFLYPGLRIQTTGGMPIWGLERFLPDIRSVAAEWRPTYRSVLIGWLRANTLVCIVPILLLAVARRGRHTAEVVAAGIAGTYAILYGLSNLWSFQYLAWSVPFWAALGWRYATLATVLTTIYVYGLYAWLCGSWLLLGEWAFVAKPDWPIVLRLARDACVIFFAAVAVQQIIGAIREERARWHAKARVG